MSKISEPVDLLIIGGGINGAGIARDAAGRGLSVVLCEQDDLASHTSSASTKLIHGGLRYLEFHEWSLVRKSLRERELLLKIAPHLISPLCFVIPHEAYLRPAWMIRAGLFLYDHLAKRKILPRSSSLDLRNHPAGLPLAQTFKRGFIYADARCDDARLVIANALDAKSKGARILTRTRCTNAHPNNGLWRVQLTNSSGVQTLRARALVNASGPWASEFAASLGVTRPLRLVRGSHIVVPRLFEHDDAYLFQGTDGRVVFAIPYYDDFTLLGTTEVDHVGTNPEISGDEITYLCTIAQERFKKQITPTQIIWKFSGIRPLIDDAIGEARSASRDYLVECPPGNPPLVNIWGGKITTYRKLAEDVCAQLSTRLSQIDLSWTADAPLPGGDLEIPEQLIVHYDIKAYLKNLQQAYPWLPSKLTHAYLMRHGSRSQIFLAGKKKLADLGKELTPGLYEAEARYFIEYEWATNAEDILWRRSKCGLFCSTEAAHNLQTWVNNEIKQRETISRPKNRASLTQVREEITRL